MHNPKTKRPGMTIKSGSSQLLGQWICNITLAWNLANFDISSVKDLSDEMIPPEYMFGSLVLKLEGSIILLVEALKNKIFITCHTMQIDKTRTYM